MSLYEHIVRAKEEGDRELQEYEKRSLSFIGWLLERIRIEAGWPEAQFTREELEFRPNTRKVPYGYLDEDGFHFGFECSLPRRTWWLAFEGTARETMRSPDIFAVTLAGETHEVALGDGQPLTTLIRAVSRELRNHVRSETLANLREPKRAETAA